MAKVTPVPLKHKENDKGEVPLYLRLSAEDKIRYKSLGVKLHKRHWNDNQQRVRKSHKQHRRINALIQQRLSEAEAAILDLRREGLTVTPERIKKRLEGESTDSADLLTFGFKVVDRFERNGQVNTAKSYGAALRKLEDYAGGSLSFAEVTPAYLEDYRAHLADEHGNGLHTVVNDLSVLRALFNRAVREGHVEAGDNPFLSFNMPSRPKAKRERLTLGQIRKLERLELEGEDRLQEARDVFLFCLYAQGMRIRDALLLRRSSVRDGRVEYTMSKTGEHKSVRLVPAAQEIAGRYLVRGGGSSDALLFPLLKDCDVSTAETKNSVVESATARLNERLKRVADRAGMDVALSTHLSRHSFASLALENDWGVAEIKKALGHSSLAVTERYLKGFSDTDLDDRMDDLFSRGEDNE